MFGFIVAIALAGAPTKVAVKPAAKPEKAFSLVVEEVEKLFVDVNGDVHMDGQAFKCAPDLSNEGWLHCRAKPKEEKK